MTPNVAFFENDSFKDQIPRELTFGVVYKFQGGLCNETYYGETVRHVVTSDKHIGLSPLINNKNQTKRGFYKRSFAITVCNF